MRSIFHSNARSFLLYSMESAEGNEPDILHRIEVIFEVVLMKQGREKMSNPCH